MSDYLKEAPPEVLLDAVKAVTFRKRPDDAGLSPERLAEVRRYFRALLSASSSGDGGLLVLLADSEDIREAE